MKGTAYKRFGGSATASSHYCSKGRIIIAAIVLFVVLINMSAMNTADDNTFPAGLKRVQPKGNSPPSSRAVGGGEAPLSGAISNTEQGTPERFNFFNLVDSIRQAVAKEPSSASHSGEGDGEGADKVATSRLITRSIVAHAAGEFEHSPKSFLNLVAPYDNAILSTLYGSPASTTYASSLGLDSIPNILIPHLIGSGFAHLRLSTHKSVEDVGVPSLRKLKASERSGMLSDSTRCKRGNAQGYFRGSGVLAVTLDALAYHANWTTAEYGWNQSEPCPGMSEAAYYLTVMKHSEDSIRGLSQDLATYFQIPDWDAWAALPSDHHTDLSFADLLFAAALESRTASIDSPLAPHTGLSYWAKEFVFAVTSSSRWAKESGWAFCRAAQYGPLISRKGRKGKSLFSEWSNEELSLAAGGGQNVGHLVTQKHSEPQRAVAAVRSKGIPPALTSVLVAREIRRRAYQQLANTLSELQGTAGGVVSLLVVPPPSMEMPPYLQGDHKEDKELYNKRRKAFTRVLMSTESDGNTTNATSNVEALNASQGDVQVLSDINTTVGTTAAEQGDNRTDTVPAADKNGTLAEPPEAATERNATFESIIETSTLYKGFVPRLLCVSWFPIALEAFSTRTPLELTKAFHLLRKMSKEYYAPDCGRHMVLLMLPLSPEEAGKGDTRELSGEERTKATRLLKQWGVATLGTLESHFPTSTVVLLPVVANVDVECSRNDTHARGECEYLSRAMRTRAVRFLYESTEIPRLSFNIYRHHFDEANHRAEGRPALDKVDRLAGTGRRGPDESEHFLKRFIEDYFVLIPPTTVFFPLHFFSFVNAPRQVAEARSMGIPRMWGPAATTGTTEGDDDDTEGREASSYSCFTDANRLTIMDRRMFESIRTARKNICDEARLSNWTTQVLSAFNNPTKLAAMPNEMFLMIAKEPLVRQGGSIVNAPAGGWETVRVQQPFDCVMRARYRVSSPRDDLQLPLIYSLRGGSEGIVKRSRRWKSMYVSPFAFGIDHVDIGFCDAMLAV